jgi:hypothetical protein
MNAGSFLKDITRDEAPILYHCIKDNNIEALETLAQLPFFTEIIN